MMVDRQKRSFLTAQFWLGHFPTHVPKHLWFCLNICPDIQTDRFCMNSKEDTYDMKWSANGLQWFTNGLQWSTNGLQWSTNGHMSSPCHLVIL